MPKPFDAASKHLIELRPGDWLALAGFPLPASTADISVVDADLSNVMTTAADKLIRVDHAPKGIGTYLAHVEFQSSADSDLDRRVHMYNAVSRRRHGLPVWSVVFLLRPAALTPAVTGRVFDRLNESTSLDFTYHLVLVWELPPELLLTGGLGTLPLTPISAVEIDQLPPLIEQVRKRFSDEIPVQQGKEFLLAMRVLMGLKYQEQLTETLMQSIAEMEDSVEWQKIFQSGKMKGKAEGKAEGRAEGKAEGVVEGERILLIRLATDRFGTPAESVLKRLQSINDAEELSRVASRLLHVSSWEALLEV
jgi:predicted transposase YdaD